MLFRSDYTLFLQIAELGEELTELHLLKHKSLNKPITKYKGRGSDKIEKHRYDEERQCVFINDENYFEGITPNVWNYMIGGYQVLDKYSKSHMEESITDPIHFCRVVTSINATLQIQRKMDELFRKLNKDID